MPDDFAHPEANVEQARTRRSSRFEAGGQVPVFSAGQSAAWDGMTITTPATFTGPPWRTVLCCGKIPIGRCFQNLSVTELPPEALPLSTLNAPQTLTLHPCRTA